MKTISIEFDGGTSCNIPRLGFGEGYGSYQIGDQPIKRVKFGKGHSCNSAEIRTLISALHDLADQMPPHMVNLEIHGDSQIALKWANPKYMKKPSHKTTENFRNAIVELRKIAIMFANITTKWRGRDVSVALFGH